VPIPLTIVLLASDLARGAILCRANSSPLLFCHDAIGRCSIFHPVDVPLLFIQPMSFSFVQLSTRSPLIDPLLLVHLPLIDHRGFGLGKDRPDYQQCHPPDHEQYVIFHHHRVLHILKFGPLATDIACGHAGLAQLDR
jgi:hypothetical protein